MQTTYHINLSVELTDNHCDEIVALFDAFLKRHHESVQHANCDVRSSFYRKPVEHRLATFGPLTEGKGEPQKGPVQFHEDTAHNTLRDVVKADSTLKINVTGLAEDVTPSNIEVEEGEPASPEPQPPTIDKDTVFAALRQLVKDKGAAAAAVALKNVGATRFTEVQEANYPALYAAIEAQQ